MKLLRLLILFGLISVLVACDRKEYYSVVINTSRQMESLDEEQMDKVMLAFAKKKYPIEDFFYMFISIPEWRPYSPPIKMQVQRQLQKLIEDATDIEAPDVAKDLYGPNCKLSEYEAIRKRLVTSDLIRKLIKTEMDKDETSLRHIRYFSEVPYTCRLIAMSKTLKNPNNIIVEDNIIKVGDIHICQLKDSEGNLIRYRSVTGTIWRDNPDGTNIDVTLDSELD
ncbi:uncharacterized protein LOC126835169 isoform X1 [Adelges cooleyi]|uniref:uncharacterized protein LOC126835169 isoform X1 n=1 Tax=Adelges cooleyi TaxID=133065 RepID=UPI00217FB45D|nr:uncharacterized protein LOC126835169 isoform X1 [Adelges cooleyi]